MYPFIESSYIGKILMTMILNDAHYRTIVAENCGTRVMSSNELKVDYVAGMLCFNTDVELVIVSERHIAMKCEWMSLTLVIEKEINH